MNILKGRKILITSIWIIRFILIGTTYFLIKKNFSSFELAAADMLPKDPEMIKTNLLRMHLISSLLLLIPNEFFLFESRYINILLKPIAILSYFSLVNLVGVEHYGAQILLFPIFLWVIIESGIIQGAKEFHQGPLHLTNNSIMKSVAILSLVTLSFVSVYYFFVSFSFFSKLPPNIASSLEVVIFIVPLSALFSKYIGEITYSLLSIMNKN